VQPARTPDSDRVIGGNSSASISSVVFVNSKSILQPIAKALILLMRKDFGLLNQIMVKP
jgi:hypothetical protein